MTRDRNFNPIITLSIEDTPYADLAWRIAIWQEAPIGIAIIAWNMDGYRNGQFVIPNPFLCALLGYPLKELEKKTFMEVTHPADLDADLEASNGLMLGHGNSYTMIKRYVTRDGQDIWVRLTGTAVRWAMDHPDQEKRGRFRCFVSWVDHLPSSGGNYKVKKNDCGSVTEVRPTVSLGEVIGDNWKVLVMIGAAFVGFIKWEELAKLLFQM